MRHFIDIADHEHRLIRALIETAKVRKKARGNLPKGALDPKPSLKDFTLGMVFEKPSTRTRLSFEAGMMQLGGRCHILQNSDMQLGRGETIEDTARVMSRFMDAVMIRANDHETLLKFARAGSIPVINALTDRSHPCQLLADIMTLEEKMGSIEGKRIAWVGDGNNVAQSLVEIAGILKFDVVMATPKDYRLKTLPQNDHGLLSTVEDPYLAVKGADAVMTDTWVSMGDKDHKERLDAFAPYQVNETLMKEAAQHCQFLHCLPAHRGEEVTDAVLDGPQSAVWDQAENRLHVQKAVLLWCLLGESGLHL